ncbi:trimethyllysine dioxygenase, mitochondrial isoform X4 [Physeter macrocephalus]|uniref:trimethyllysine dioxygenase n=1 Tax=Physeter macrocephalus TaxID=9755 RepID=A0A2Y9S8D1_PHYMC|nr:trimethyllysine dioxygenase, mitochondrial isoform X4 [Physeter catodon]|eukprot:XP_023972510.1 trimethyllysine dioxygenase, mitochondrial isoform X4 [Physeter catodon]
MWCRRLSHLQSRLQDLLRGRVTCWAPQQPNFKSLFPLAIHWHHTASTSLNCVWQQHEDHFELQYANTVMRFDYVWLRDHCRSASCYNSKTHQRSLDTATVDLCIQPKTIRLDETTLFFTWPDGHVTRYDLDWLVKNSYEGQKQKVIQPRILWNAEIYQQAQVPSVDFQSFLETKEGLKNFLQNFLLYGIAFVENVPPTQEHTEKLAERISLIRETIYGRMWYFTSDFSRGDTAYTKLALDRHTDTTYFQEPCGYNNYDRAVINTVPYDVVHRWYTAHRTLTIELRKPENEFWVKLKPGRVGAKLERCQVLFIDNWRVLHGRESFTGYRQLCGCSLTRDDVLNTARLLGLQA